MMANTYIHKYIHTYIHTLTKKTDRGSDRNTQSRDSHNSQRRMTWHSKSVNEKGNRLKYTRKRKKYMTYCN